jgi:hypothetical protein
VCDCQQAESISHEAESVEATGTRVKRHQSMAFEHDNTSLWYESMISFTVDHDHSSDRRHKNRIMIIMDFTRVEGRGDNGGTTQQDFIVCIRHYDSLCV